MKKRWFGVAIVGSALLALGLTGGVILAQDSDESSEEHAQTGTADTDSAKTMFAERVAEILDLPAEDVKNAFAEAKQQLVAERVQTAMDRLVAAGRLTQEEADSVKAWYATRPDALAGGLPFGKRGFHGFRGPGKGMDMDGDVREFMENSPLKDLLEDRIGLRAGGGKFKGLRGHDMDRLPLGLHQGLSDSDDDGGHEEGA